jgi:hypothetical protein
LRRVGSFQIRQGRRGICIDFYKWFCFNRKKKGRKHMVMKSPKNPSTVVGVFVDRAQAEQAIQALERAGYTDRQIGFIRPGEQTSRETKTDTGTKVAAGVGSGGVVGGIVGTAAALLIPGLGPALAGGILAATLGGATIGAAAGGLIGALTNLGVGEEDARYYQDELQAGRTVIIVKAEHREQEARNLLRQYGAYDAATGA